MGVHSFPMRLLGPRVACSKVRSRSELWWSESKVHMHGYSTRPYTEPHRSVPPPLQAYR